MSFQETIQKLNEIDFNDLSNIDPNSVGTWPLAGKVAIWATLFLVVIFGLYQANISVLLEEYRKEESKEKFGCSKLERCGKP